MRLASGPAKREVFPGKQWGIHDFPPGHFKAWATQTMNPKFTRLLCAEAQTTIRPMSLRARFTEPEIDRILGNPPFESLLAEAFHEISALTGNPLLEIKQRLAINFPGPPFDIIMTAEAIADPDEQAVNASSANLLETHTQGFSPDSTTEAITRHVLAQEESYEDTPGNGLYLDIRGDFPDDEIKRANEAIRIVNEIWGCSYNSRVVKPTLSMALQAAIAKLDLPVTAFRSSTTRTTALGPHGSPIVVTCYLPGMPILLCEEADLQRMVRAPRQIPDPMISHCLFKPLIAPEEIN